MTSVIRVTRAAVSLLEALHFSEGSAGARLPMAVVSRSGASDHKPLVVPSGAGFDSFHGVLASQIFPCLLSRVKLVEEVGGSQILCAMEVVQG